MSYFTVEEDLKQLHIQIPKALLYEKKYTGEKKLSSDAKILYGFFLDRVSLSLKNGWFDDQDRLYIKCDQITMSKVLGCSEKKARNIKNELIAFDLLEEVKVGQGKSNRLYPKKVVVTKTELSNYIDLFLEEVSTERKKERERVSKYKNNNGEDVENTKNGKNDRSRTDETTVLEQSNCVYSNTDSSNTDFKVVIVVDKLKSIINLFKSFKLEKRVMPHTTNLLKQYTDIFDLDVFEQIFIDASSENVKNKYRYIKEVLETLESKGIFTIEKYNEDRKKFKGSKNKKFTKSKKNKFNNFEQSIDSMSEEELMKKIEVSQNIKFGDKSLAQNKPEFTEDTDPLKVFYERAVNSNWCDIGQGTYNMAIGYAKKYNKPYVNL